MDGAGSLEERLAEVGGHLNVLHGRLVGLVVEAIETDAWSGAGIRSLAHWLSWKAGVSPTTARALIALAEARTSHPVVSQLLVDGAVTVDQTVAAITAPAHCDAVMADLAPLATVPQIRLAARAARCTLDNVPTVDPVAAAAAPPSEMVSFGIGDDGRWWMHAELDADHGRVVEQALREARDRLFAAGDRDVDWPAALADVAARSLGECPETRRDLYRLNAFLDRRGPTATATWADGTRLPDAIRRLITCDGAWTPVFTDGAAPVSVGRTQRIIPERTRRLIEHRDHGRCRVPWCASRAGLQIHHIVHWEDGGPTDTRNLVIVCAACHRHHHHGRLGITGDADDPDGLTFTNSRGDPIERIRPQPPTDPPPAPRTPYHHPLGEPLSPHALYGIFPQPVP